MIWHTSTKGLFSRAGLICTTLRNRLAPKTIQCLTTLHYFYPDEEKRMKQETSREKLLLAELSIFPPLNQIFSLTQLNLSSAKVTATSKISKISIYYTINLLINKLLPLNSYLGSKISCKSSLLLLSLI